MHTYRITGRDDSGWPDRCEVGHYAPDGSWVVNQTTESELLAQNICNLLNGGLSPMIIHQWEELMDAGGELLERLVGKTP